MIAKGFVGGVRFWLFIFVASVGITLATSGFKIEDQVLHIESELAEGLLDEVQDAATAAGAVDHAIGQGFQQGAELGREAGNGSGEVSYVLGEFFLSDSRVVGSWGHVAGSDWEVVGVG